MTDKNEFHFGLFAFHLQIGFHSHSICNHYHLFSGAAAAGGGAAILLSLTKPTHTQRHSLCVSLAQFHCDDFNLM